MREILSSSICLGNENFSRFDCTDIFADIVTLHVSDSSFSTIDQMDGDLATQILVRPPLKVCRNSKRGISRYQIDNRIFTKCANFSENPKSTFVTHQHIKLVQLTVLLDVRCA